MRMKEKLKNSEIVGEILEWVYAIVLALTLAFLTKYYIGTFTTVQQSSMSPTLNNEDKLWLNRIPRTLGWDYERGDIVTFESPEGGIVTNESPKARYLERANIFEAFTKGFLEIDKFSLIKRVIAKGGDKVLIEDGKIHVNGEPIKEEYFKKPVETTTDNLTEFTVPEGYYFLVGDNREASLDGRTFGVVPKEKIEGKVIFRIWPLGSIGNIY